MQTNISARHGHLSPSTQEQIKEKVDKLGRLYDRITAVQVTVDLEHREMPSVEMRVSIAHGDALMATDQSGDVIAALDGALHKVEQQIRRQKDRRTERRRPPLKHLDLPAEGEAEAE